MKQQEITFESFVYHEYDEHDSSLILKAHQDESNQKVFSLSANLIIWSIFGLTADILMGLLAGYLTYTYGLHF